MKGAIMTEQLADISVFEGLQNNAHAGMGLTAGIGVFNKTDIDNNRFEGAFDNPDFWNKRWEQIAQKIVELAGTTFERLPGRIEAMGVLYQNCAELKAAMDKKDYEGALNADKRVRQSLIEVNSTWNETSTTDLFLGFVSVD